MLSSQGMSGVQIYNEAKLASSPVVVERELSASLLESAPVGSFVAQVHTNSSGCHFELKGDGVPFSVDRNSGRSCAVFLF